MEEQVIKCIMSSLIMRENFSSSVANEYKKRFFFRGWGGGGWWLQFIGEMWKCEHNLVAAETIMNGDSQWT